MKRSSSQARLTHRLALFISLTLGILLLSFPRPFAADKAAQAGWRFSIKAGEQTRSNLALNNRCSAPHLFRVKSRIKYLRFEQPTNAILIGAASTRQVGMVFDATGLKPKVYRANVVVECLDCKKEKGCSQDRDELPVEMTVMRENQYSWCVEASLQKKTMNSSCKVISVTPNYTPGPCKGSFLTIPNDGTPVPKVGDSLHIDKCPLTPGKRFPPNTNVKVGQ